MNKNVEKILNTEEYIKNNPKHYEKLKRYLYEDDDIRVILRKIGTENQRNDYNLNQQRYKEVAKIIEANMILPYVENLSKQIKYKREKSSLSAGLWCMSGAVTFTIGLATNNIPIKLASIIMNGVGIIKYSLNYLKPAGTKLFKRGQKILQEWAICKHLPHYIQDFAMLNDINLFDSPFEGDSNIFVNYEGFLTDIKLPSEHEDEIQYEQGE